MEIIPKFLRVLFLGICKSMKKEKLFCMMLLCSKKGLQVLNLSALVQLSFFLRRLIHQSRKMISPLTRGLDQRVGFLLPGIKFSRQGAQIALNLFHRTLISGSLKSSRQSSKYLRILLSLTIVKHLTVVYKRIFLRQIWRQGTTEIHKLMVRESPMNRYGEIVYATIKDNVANERLGPYSCLTSFTT